MPWIREATVSDARDYITVGARLVRRYWPDDRTPHMATEWQTAEAVVFDADGWLTVTYLRYGGERRTPDRCTALYSPDDVIAVDQTTDANDSRLILPGGYMDARPGRNWRSWDVYLADGTQLAEEVSTEEGRALLAEHAPEMVWEHYGDGTYLARGHGRAWRIERGRRNPAFTAHTPLSQAWLYNLSSRPLEGEEWQEVARDCATPQDAKGAAPARTA